MRALVYCNFLKEVRLGGWGSEGPKAPTLGQYISACATVPLGSGSVYLVLRKGTLKTKYIVSLSTGLRA